MANKRTLKKAVDILGADMCESMMIAYVNVENADRKAIADAIGKITDGVETARHHANTFFDRSAKSFGGDRKAYNKAKRAFNKALFARIIADFNKVVNESLKEFNGALPKAEKEANKASAAK